MEEENNINDKGSVMNKRLDKQLEYIFEIDKVKSVIRKTRLFHKDKYENDAEHSWHICMMALVLQEYANGDIDILKVIKMMLIHDLVEIDTGDVIVYNKTQQDTEAEKTAAKRIFGMLPDGQGDEYLNLWMEFEDRKTKEAKFAMALDRMEPLLQNLYRDGDDWKRNNIPYEKVISVNMKIKDGSKELWEYIRNEIDRLNEDGIFNNIK